MKTKIILVSILCLFTQISSAANLKMIVDLWDSMCNLEKKELVLLDYKINKTEHTAHSYATTMSMCISGLEKSVKENKHKLSSDLKNKVAQYCANKYVKK